MFSRHWLPYLAAAGFALAVGAYAQPVTENAGSQPGPAEAEKAPESHPEPPAYEAIQGSIARIAAAIEAIAAKDDPPEKDAREESDLRAQWEMAKWAEWVAWATAIQSIFTFIGIGLVWRTLHWTKRAVSEAAHATEAANRALEITSQSAERQLRAYVCMKGIFHNPARDGVPEHVTVAVINSGQTPAHNLSGWCASATGSRKNFSRPEKEFRLENFTLGPGQVFDIRVPVPTPEQRLLIAANEGEAPVFVWGELTYDDVFGRDRRKLTFRVQKDIGTSDDGSDVYSTAYEGNECT